MNWPPRAPKRDRAVRFVIVTMTILLMVTAWSAPLAAQTITVRLLNGKTGKPMRNKMVTAQWEPGLEKSEITIGKNGVGVFEVFPGSKRFRMKSGPKLGKDSGRIAYIDCNEPIMPFFQIKEVLETGVVPKNGCGHHTAILKPGEIVFWAAPKPWWQPDFQ